MKNLNPGIKLIMTAVLLLSFTCGFAQTKTPRDIILECSTFLKTNKPVMNSTSTGIVKIDFSITDANGIISGGPSVPSGVPFCVLDSFKVVKSGMNNFTLTANNGIYKSTYSNQTNQTYKIVASTSPLDQPFTITYLSTNNTVSNIVKLPDTAIVQQIGTSSSTGNEYIIYGLATPSNPTRLISIHIKQSILSVE